MSKIVNNLFGKMKESSPAFKDLFREFYFGGSTFDGLKVGSSGHEFDLDVVFKGKAENCCFVGLGNDPTNKNFCFIKITADRIGSSYEEISATRGNEKYLSPEMMFSLIQKTMDRVLSRIDNKLDIGDEIYKITRSITNPLTIKVVGGRMSFEVDLVPSIKFDLCELSSDKTLQRHINGLCSKFKIPPENGSFMAKSLPRADKGKFELDFHDIERQILYNRGCVKKVIKLMKYMRDEKGGPMLKLWSHLIKVSIQY